MEASLNSHVNPLENDDSVPFFFHTFASFSFGIVGVVKGHIVKPSSLICRYRMYNLLKEMCVIDVY
jgi:hypothetical protein